MRGLMISLMFAILMVWGHFAVNAQTYGTTQMEGQWGELGKEYTLCPDDPMNFKLRSAEFVASRIRIGDEVFFPNAKEKFLVLHYTIHNPQKREMNASWDTFEFTAVDATNENREYSEEVGQEDNNLPLGSIYLKPAQEIKVFTFIPVPAKGVIPKLIVKRGDGPVLRYDLKEKVKPLEPPFLDESDPTGATALKDIPAEMGAFYPTGVYDLRVDSAAYTKETLEGYEPEEGTHHLVINVSIVNMSGETQNVYWATFLPTVQTKDGERIGYNQVILHGKRNESLSTELEPDQEIKARFFFQVYDDDPAKTLYIEEFFYDENLNRRFVFDLSTIELER